MIAIDWYLKGAEISRKCVETRDNERPVEPSSMQANENIICHISKGNMFEFMLTGGVSILSHLAMLLVYVQCLGSCDTPDNCPFMNFGLNDAGTSNFMRYLSF